MTLLPGRRIVSETTDKMHQEDQGQKEIRFWSAVTLVTCIGAIFCSSKIFAKYFTKAKILEFAFSGG